MANGRGGHRAGAGRKAKPPGALDIPAGKDPLDFLIAVMDAPDVEPSLRVRAAIAAAQYKHMKLHDGGKKEERDRAAKSAGEGKYRPADAPKAENVH